MRIIINSGVRLFARYFYTDQYIYLPDVGIDKWDKIFVPVNQHPDILKIHESLYVSVLLGNPFLEFKKLAESISDGNPLELAVLYGEHERPDRYIPEQVIAKYTLFSLREMFIEDLKPLFKQLQTTSVSFVFSCESHFYEVKE